MLYLIAIHTWRNRATKSVAINKTNRRDWNSQAGRIRGRQIDTRNLFELRASRVTSDCNVAASTGPNVRRIDRVNVNVDGRCQSSLTAQITNAAVDGDNLVWHVSDKKYLIFQSLLPQCHKYQLEDRQELKRKLCWSWWNWTAPSCCFRKLGGGARLIEVMRPSQWRKWWPRAKS